MRYVAAYLLAALGGNKDPSAADVEKILGSVGIEADNERLSKVISELKGKDVAEVIAKGQEKLASVPSGGAVAASGAAAPAAGGGAGAAAPKEAAKKEEKKEESEEEDDDMGFGLFD
ncbi:large ribosomal subunit protein P2-like [Ornithodoros turicata]|uniref:large ribosomal subunit protein P2-like n=1 Tax=Ornithodoros turicata TaxID=34597 RepID=UPI003138DC12